ncbi:class I SAM-dependent methyltransferase [Brachyspira aalborgi]|uniref:Class I SAM-dependent methyltransferase n=1 Tax=Brachyspira aalborgi TaxID=29522 RepID=A0A5C8FZW6_9SPIR|nr:class I SAM-dependent methyltransferase [Brachyspira aalborgi]
MWSGYFIQYWKGKKVYGIEINDKAVAYAKYKYESENIIYNQGNILNLPFDDEMFDVFTSFETIEHVNDEDTQMKEVKRVLKKGGLYILSTPNNWGLTEFHVKDYDYFSIKELVSKYFKIQKIYNQNSETANTKRQIIETTENNYKEAECFIIVAIKE